MRYGSSVLLLLLASLASAGVSAQDEEPRFQLRFTGAFHCSHVVSRFIRGGEVAPKPLEMLCTLTTFDNPGEAGAQGWMVSLAAENLDRERRNACEVEISDEAVLLLIERTSRVLECVLRVRLGWLS